ncbi:nuclear pore complex protein NUP50B-like [Typha latifolia]|uniref:nuclear pore complex protein NUP50B-like n=1 Tax=Typha latifolia TaxID=4733 RepID=UPI003C2E3EA5
MGDEENALPASKKRVAGRQISKDSPELDDDAPEPEMGTFQKASEEVMATRRIVKVRRNQPPSAPSSNPFAGIRLVPSSDKNANTSSPADHLQSGGDGIAPDEQNNSTVESEKTNEGNQTEGDALLNEAEGKEEGIKNSEEKTNESASKSDDSNAIAKPSEPEASEKVENGEKETVNEAREETCEDSKEDTSKAAEGDSEAKDREETEDEKDTDHKEKTLPAAPLSSFQQLSSSQNAFTGIAGTGFSTSSFSFGSVASDGSNFASSGTLFGLKNDNSSYPSFGLGSTNNGSSASSILGIKSEASKSGVISMQEVPVETGEENEKAVFTADAILYEYLDGGWKERGKGELKMNVSTSGAEKARLIMRTKGNYRLILNASLYPDMSLKDMDKKGVTFACVNSAAEGKDGLTTFALKFKDSSIREEFGAAVAAHKGEKSPVLKTPENSPKASDD